MRRIFRRCAKWLSAFLSVLGISWLTSCHVSKSPSVKIKPPIYKIVGYVNGGTMPEVEAVKLSHINYAFAVLNPDGSIYFPNDSAAIDLQQLNSLKEANPYLKVLVSIGGWGADHFSDAALTDSSRVAFAGHVADFVQTHALDGVDLDWEYPGQPGPGITYRQEDKENFTLLVETVRKRLNELTAVSEVAYTLTIAASYSDAYFQNTEMIKLQEYVDFFNVMTYDFFTGGSQTTGHHAALYKSEFDTTIVRTQEKGIARFLQEGIPLEKIVMGVAFYGRGWKGVGNINNGVFQSYQEFYGAYGYRELIADYIDKNGFSRHWDTGAKVPYLWNADSSIFISYEDPESLRYKAQFVQQHNLGGIMYWQHRHDSNGEMLHALYEVLNK